MKQTTVQEMLAALQAERAPLTAQLDAIDLAIENLRRVWPSDGERPADVAFDRRKAILTALDGAKDGLSTAELKAATPGMDGKARSNALFTLKRAHMAKRVRGRWTRCQR